LKKIITGGQTGVDRAALDAAIALNIPHGGWCPKGRLAEDGVIDAKYQLKETKSNIYAERTKLNIRDSHGTLILTSTFSPSVSNGTNLTLQEAKNTNKPYKLFGLSVDCPIDEITDWISENHIKILNIAGPRESESSGVYQKSARLLTILLTQ